MNFGSKVDIESGAIIGAEALLRWQHPTKGLIAPAKFIHIAENTGFIWVLGHWVIEETARLIRRMEESGYHDIHISCNVSTRQFQNPRLYDEIAQAVMHHAITPCLFAVEITESVMMEFKKITFEFLHKIKSLGVHICMDDFGTGYSSLSYLRQFPIDSLKIDKSFIDDITQDMTNEQPLVNTIIAMGQSLGLNVIAEGVEEQYQIAYLKSKGCQYYQGYLFSKPLPEDEFFDLLQTQGGTHGAL